ncbi:MAG: type I methionyl aminopeptidase [Caldicoprobacterales bacterium]|nr:type I methionyl aminopeptidase [Clostridiales bacterium]
MIIVKSKNELAIMQEAGRIVAGALEVVKNAVAPGITTAELDKLAKEYIISQGATPAFKGYQGYPANICTSVNDQVVHGIPGPIALKEGDIISVDIGAFYKGYCGDAARTYPVGKVSSEALDLIKVTKEAFFKGLEFARVGYRVSDISHAIQVYVEERGYSVVKALVGHGIGQEMHEEPQVPNFGPPGRGPRLREGMTLAIEPMVNQGTDQVRVLDDGWTVVTQDGSLSAHYEHTIAITRDQPLILTQGE